MITGGAAASSVGSNQRPETSPRAHRLQVFGADGAEVRVVRVVAHLLLGAPRRDEPAHAIDDAEERAGIGVTGGAHLGQAAQLGQQPVDHISTKANPRARPVAASRMTRTDSTVPALLNSSCSSAAFDSSFTPDQVAAARRQHVHWEGASRT
jgi:hypothetical protein